MKYYDKIRNMLLDNQNYKRKYDYLKNKNDLMTYYNVGKILNNMVIMKKDKKYSDNVIKEYSSMLTAELGKGYSVTNLKYMLKFSAIFEDVQEISYDLIWSHYVELLYIEDINKIKYYIKVVQEEKISYRELHRRIKNMEYEKNMQR